MNKVKRLLRYDIPLHIVLTVTNWLPDNVVFIRLRGMLVSPFFRKCGKKFGVGRNVTFYNSSQIEIGDNVYIAYGGWFAGSYGIKIEDEVLFGPYTILATSDHTKVNGSYRFGKPIGASIRIGKGSWIGAHATILKGISVGMGALVAANSVVTKDVNPFTVVGGIPAKAIRSAE